MKQSFMRILAALVAFLKSITSLLIPMFLKYLIVHHKEVIEHLEDKAQDTESPVDDTLVAMADKFLGFLAEKYRDVEPVPAAEMEV